MNKVPPQPIIKRSEVDLCLGVNQSLSSLKELIAAYISFYLVNNEKSTLDYSLPTKKLIKGTMTDRIIMEPTFMAKLNKFFSTQISKTVVNLEDSLNNGPFFVTQVEPLNLGLKLYWKLGTITSKKMERTSSVRYPRSLNFSINAIFLKKILSAHNDNIDNEVKDLLFEWITKSSGFKINTLLENKLLEILTCLSEDSQFKIKWENKSIIFQQESIYDQIVKGDTIEGKGDNPAGPLRILRSLIDQKLHPYIENNMEFQLNTGNKTLIELTEYKNKVSTYLDIQTSKTNIIEYKELQKEFIFEKTLGRSTTYKYKNLLFKGVPGTGKSRIIYKIIEKKLKLNKKEHKNNILHINIHSASSNADLMQGIGITTEDNQVAYKEKQGLIYEHIRKACYAPVQPFVLILEEIQENSLNELIGDLIYLIEPSKRLKVGELTSAFSNGESVSYTEGTDSLVSRYIAQSHKEYKDLKEKGNPTYKDFEVHSVDIPYLVSTSTEYRTMVLPDNLYVFCTSNYRDDKKVIEDNLLRRFDVIELYPQYEDGYKDNSKKGNISDFLRELNDAIQKAFKEEIHPDRFQVGHANWINIKENSKDTFCKALLKVVIDFKEIREIESKQLLDIFSETLKELPDTSWIKVPFKLAIEEFGETSPSYAKLVSFLQQNIYKTDILELSKD